MARRTGSGEGIAQLRLAVVVAVLGTLAAFAVPRFLTSIERSRAEEAFDYLSAIRAAQGRHLARRGTFAARLADLDVPIPHLRYFRTAGIEESDPVTLRTAWQLTLTRRAESGGPAAYTVVFNQDGFDAESSTIATVPGIGPVWASGGDR